MRKKLTTYIEEEDIKKLKILALEQDTSVSDILCSLVSTHFNIKIVCISDFDKILKLNRIKLNDIIFEFDRYKSLDESITFYKDDKVIKHIENSFFEVYEKENYIEIIPIEAEDFTIVNDEYVKIVK